MPPAPAQDVFVWAKTERASGYYRVTAALRMDVMLHDFAASSAFHKADILIFFICPHVAQQ